MPQVSVIMPSCNHELYVSESIESVLNQTFDDFKLIIIDDASKDKSKGIIKHHANQDPRIEAVYHSENQGIAKTLNEGLAIAQGKYIAITASDDVWLDHKLEKQMEIINKNKNSIVWSDAYVIDAKGNDIGQLWTQRYKAEKRKKSGNIFFELLWDNFVSSQSMIFKRDVTKKIKFDTSLTYANDYKFIIDLSKYYQYHFIAEPLVKYRIHSDNSTSKNQKLWARDMIKFYRKEIREHEKVIPARLKAKLFYRLSKYFLMRKRRKFSRYYLWQAFRHNSFKASYLRNLLRSFFSFDSNNIC